MRVGDLMLGVRLVHRAMRYRWKLNRREIAAMLEHLPSGGTALDVGAHKGGYAWWMARRVGKAGRVYAFEPQQRVARPTARAMRALGAAQVRVIQAAVSSAPGRSSMAMRGSSTHGASLDGLEGPDIEKIDVAVVSLDDFVRRERLSRVDFVKIDVEGHEMSVLKGAKNLLARFGPSVLVEVEARHHETGAEGTDTLKAATGVSGDDPVLEVRTILEGLGYSGWFFSRAGRRPISEFRAAEHQRYGEGYYSNNFLFVRESTPAATSGASSRV